MGYLGHPLRLELRRRPGLRSALPARPPSQAAYALLPRGSQPS